MLSDRKRKILQVVVDDYIRSAEPVSSKALCETHFNDLSSATIRNELAQLEGLGLLAHTHTSSGRVPTSLAYKMYIEDLIDQNKLSEKELDAMKHYFDGVSKSTEDIVKKAVDALSEMTDYTSVARVDELKNERVESVKLVKLSNRNIVLVVVTESGTVKNVIIDGEFDETQEEVTSAEAILNKHIVGKGLAELDKVESEIKNDFAVYRELFVKIIEALKVKVREQSGNLYLSGESKIFRHKEYNDLDNVKEFISVIESRDELKGLLESSADGKIAINVTIGGDENNLPKDCTLVSASYRYGDKDFGTYGVIGPSRMDYNKVLKVLSGIGEILNDIINKK